MAEIIYKYLSENKKELDSSLYIKWLDKNDLQVFNHHLEMCGQTIIDNALWDKIYDAGTIYAGLFFDGKMVARACVEKYSNDAWEIADVRVVKTFRNKGFAYAVCSYVLHYILNNKIIQTIRTEEDNYSMQKVISKLGFISEY